MCIVPSPACGGLSFLISVLSPLPRVHLGLCRFLTESCHLSSWHLRLIFGISLQDGYSRGSSRTSFSQAVSPCMLPPSLQPPGSAASPSVPALPAGYSPSPRGAWVPLVQDADGRRQLRGHDTRHNVCRASRTSECEADTDGIYITDLVGFLSLPYILCSNNHHHF